MKQPDTAAARDRAKRLVKLSKERDMYFTEKDGTRADSVSVRYPAYAGTVLEAKHGGRIKKDDKFRCRIDGRTNLPANHKSVESVPQEKRYSANAIPDIRSDESGPNAIR